ncbi:predicted protein, partial [Nematostella vectensis]
MSTISPPSLEQICLNYICGSIQVLCYEVQENVGNLQRIAFKFPVFLHEQLAESILRQLACTGQLTLNVLTLFMDQNTCRLKRACIRSSDVREIGLRLILMHHNITELDICGTEIPFSELFASSLEGYECTSSLRKLNISHAKGEIDYAALGYFKNLTSLDVSHNMFSDFDLKQISIKSPNLLELNISCTSITDAEAFGHLRSSLITLKAYHCPISWQSPTEFAKFTALRHLDISRNPGSPEGYDWPGDAEKLEMLLLDQNALRNLEILDISGTPRVMDLPLQVFISSHPRLKFLGLCNTGLSSYAKFLPKDIEITGEATEQQILLSLCCYPERSSYMTESLRRLFQISKNWTQARFEVLQIVLPPMEKHPKDLRVQMAATACVFNLTRFAVTPKDLHPETLGRIANLVLKAMETFPRKHELLRNCLLIMDSKPMLKKAKFDYYAACMSAMDALCQFSNDLNIVKLATKICAILTAKISTYETIALGTDRHLKALMYIVEGKVEAVQADYILSVTLSVLWNLTDEACCSCQLFIDSKGLKLLLRVLKTFTLENKIIIKKVLGTMNNISEVHHLRHHFINDECIEALRNLLKCNEIDVSYFAGGILSNIALAWTQPFSTKTSRCEVLEQIIVHAFSASVELRFAVDSTMGCLGDTSRLHKKWYLTEYDAVDTM